MNRELVYSSILHLLIVTVALVASPLAKKHSINPDDVVKVTLANFPPSSTPMSPDVEPPKSEPEVAKPVVEEKVEIPAEPTKKPAVNVEKKKPEPKKKIPPKEQAKPTRTETKNDNAAPQSKRSSKKEKQVGEGSPFSGATVDNEAFNYPWWFSQAWQKIQGNLNNPVSVDVELVCVVYFQVLRSGRVLEVKVLQSSGIPRFDSACLDAVNNSAPFPPLPSDFTDEIIGITLPFRN